MKGDPSRSASDGDLNVRDLAVRVVGTVLRSLVAFPRQILSLMRRREVPWTASPSTGDVAPTVQRDQGRSGRAIVLLATGLGATLAAMILVFALGRALYYPFWAVGASSEALARSWGGPGALGATLVHWLVASVTIAVTYIVILWMGRLARRR